MDSAGNAATVEDLRSLQSFFAEHKTGTVAQLAKKLSKAREANNSLVSSHAVPRFKNMFELFHSLLINAGAQKAANDMQEISNIFVACNHATVAGCISYLSSLMTENKPIKSKRQTGSGRDKDEIRLDIVEKYTQALKRTSDDNDSFDRIVEELRRDKKARVQEIRGISTAYLGHELAKKKGRADAIKAIVDRQALNARQDARSQRFDPSKPW